MPLPAVRLKPVRARAATGEMPMSPVMTDVGTVEIPAWERIAKPAASPRSTVCAIAEPTKRAEPTTRTAIIARVIED